MSRLVLTVLFSMLLSFSAISAEKVLIYHAPESINDVRYEFHWEVLKIDNPFLPTTVPYNKKNYWLTPEMF